MSDPEPEWDVFDWIRLIGARAPRGESPPWLQEAYEGTFDPARATIISESPDGFVVEVDGKRWQLLI